MTNKNPTSHKIPHGLIRYSGFFIFTLFDNTCAQTLWSGFTSPKVLFCPLQPVLAHGQGWMSSFKFALSLSACRLSVSDEGLIRQLVRLWGNSFIFPSLQHALKNHRASKLLDCIMRLWCNTGRIYETGQPGQQYCTGLDEARVDPNTRGQGLTNFLHRFNVAQRK